MGSEIKKIDSVNENYYVPQSNNTCQTITRAILIILGVGSLLTLFTGAALTGALSIANPSLIGLAIMGAGGLGMVGTFGLTALHIACIPKTHESLDLPQITGETEVDAFIRRSGQGSIVKESRFGKSEWEKHFGKVGKEPKLPDNIEEILDSPCPYALTEGVKVRDTHMLVLIPATVNKKPLTLNYLGELMREKVKTGYKSFYYKGSVITEHGTAEVKKSYWVLMTKDVIPGSRGKPFNDQTRLLNSDYQPPSVIEAAVCTFMEFAVSGTRLYGTNTRTSCAEKVKGQFPVIVGVFDETGLGIADRTGFNFLPEDGLGAVKRLPPVN